MSEPSKEILSNSAALHALKRPQLNRLCKRFGLTAKGKNTELIGRLENLAGNISRQELDDFAGAPEESPTKKGRMTDNWEMVDDVSHSENVDFGPASPRKQAGEHGSQPTHSKSSSTLRSLASTIKNKWRDISPSKQSTVSPSKFQDVCVPMDQDSSSEDEDEQEEENWNVIPGECQPTRLSTAASIHDDTIIDDTVKLVNNDNRPPSPSPSFVNRPSLPGNNKSDVSSRSASPKVYPPLPRFVFGQQSGVSNAGFTSIMDELNRRLPTAEVKPEVEAQAETSRSPKSAAQLGLKSATNLKIKRKFDDAHENEFKKMGSIADHYAARPKVSPKKPGQPRAQTEGKTSPSKAAQYRQTTQPTQPTSSAQDEGVLQKEAKARPSVTEPSQPNKRIKVAAPTNEEKERRDDVKRRLEVSRQKRRSSMAANARGRPSARMSGGGKPPTRVATASKAAGMIKSVGKKIFGGSGSSTTNAKASSSSGGGEEGTGKTRMVKKLKKVEQAPPTPRTSAATKPTPFSFAGARGKGDRNDGSKSSRNTVNNSNNANTANTTSPSNPKNSTNPPNQAAEAQQRAAERVKMAKLKDSNKGGKGTPTKRGVRGSNANKRPSQAEQVSKARMSHSPQVSASRVEYKEKLISNTVTRLYARGRVLSHQRGKRTSRPKTSIIQVEGATKTEDAKFYLGKRIAYVYKGKKAVNGTKVRVIWGRCTRTHGNSGVVRAKFSSNLPPVTFGATCRIDEDIEDIDDIANEDSQIRSLLIGCLVELGVDEGIADEKKRKYPSIDTTLLTLLIQDYGDDVDSLLDTLNELDGDKNLDDNVLDFLKDSFPSLSSNQLNSTLINNDNNLDTTIEYLIQNEFRLSNYTTQSPSSTTSLPSNSNKKKKKQQSITPIKQFEPPTDFDWVVLDSISTSIHRQLGVSNDHLINSLKSHINSTKALTLSDALSTYLETFNHILNSTALDIFLALFSNQDIHDAKLVLQACNNRIEDAETVLHTLNHLKLSERSIDGLLEDQLNISTSNNPTKLSRAKSTPSIPSQSISTPTAWNKISKKPPKKNNQPIFPHLPQVTKDDIDSNSSNNSTNHYELYCRKMEHDFRIKRQSAIKDAGHLYYSSKSWKHGTGGIASQAKSQQARELKELADEWAVKAAKASIQSRSSLSENVVDLHYLTSQEALAVAADSVDKWWSKRPLNNNQLLKLGPLVFITGIGLHSTGKQPILFPQVARMLENQGWSIERQQSRGCILVKGR
ncbi:hypothetical protein E3P95_02374 [Wallemia ichthyophaga]|nr:hypothetical protein E3P95_02374 [Wallemia ichthyophaga]